MREDYVEKNAKSIWTTTKPDASSHDCVFAFHEKFAITYYNDDHSHFSAGQEVTLYNLLDPTMKTEYLVNH